MKKTQSVNLIENNLALFQKSKSAIFDSIGLGSIIGFVLIVLVLAFLLLASPKHVFSLYALLNWIVLLTPHEQLVAMILMPIYLAILIFGGGIVGIMLGGYFQKWLSARYFFKRVFKRF